ncbi:terminase gpP N-terminus-related DNA-binding protein [Microcoleus sp. F4-D5]
MVSLYLDGFNAKQISTKKSASKAQVYFWKQQDKVYRFSLKQ